MNMMTKSFKPVGLIFGMLALAACGGGSGNSFVADPDIEDFGSLGGVVDELVAANNRLSSLDSTPPGTVLSFDSATYNGAFGLIDNNRDTVVVGGMTFAVDFANEEATGKAGNFFNADGERVGGQLTISNADFPAAGASATAIDFDFNGELTNVRNGEGFDFALTAFATPFGTDAETMGIVAGGTAQSTTSTASFTTSGAGVLDR